MEKSQNKKVTDKKPAAHGDIIELILRDHKPLKRLIQTLKDGDIKRDRKAELFEEFVPLLVAHAKAEEKSLYMQLKETEDLRMDGYEGEVEHGIAEQLVHKINATPDDDKWNAKVKVLAELVEHHIEFEENEMLKEVEQFIDLPTRQAVGDTYTELKAEIDMLNRPLAVSSRRNDPRELNSEKSP
jgi:hemerythrin superfamily protein